MLSRLLNRLKRKPSGPMAGGSVGPSLSVTVGGHLLFAPELIPMMPRHLLLQIPTHPQRVIEITRVSLGDGLYAQRYRCHARSMLERITRDSHDGPLHALRLYLCDDLIVTPGELATNWRLSTAAIGAPMIQYRDRQYIRSLDPSTPNAIPPATRLETLVSAPGGSRPTVEAAFHRLVDGLVEYLMIYAAAHEASASRTVISFYLGVDIPASALQILSHPKSN